MNQKIIYKEILTHFLHTPTSMQAVVLQELSAFLAQKKNAGAIFLLKGFAGTGKTSIISALVNALAGSELKTVLLAPTGRAAKVIAEYSKKNAYTIHKHIYYPKMERNNIGFKLKNNKSVNTVYLVDEASMISDNYSDEGYSVLSDLIQYVEGGEHCKLILIGDTAQLPPVHMQTSPAMDAHLLESHYGKNVTEFELNQVVRQQHDSGILYNATAIRERLTDYFSSDFLLKTSGFPDIIPLMQGVDIQEAIENSYRQNGIEETIFITYSNKRAVQYNQQIRKVILGKEEELSIGDLLMVVKNNYFWLKPNSQAGFIANGDTVEVLEIHRYEDLYGFRFAEVTVQMVDYPEQPPFTLVLMLDVLTSFSPSLTYEEGGKLYQAVMQDYASEKPFRRYLKVKSSPYFNAIQVKYSYAVTCHKSQGGQWHTVFIEKPYLPNGITPEYLRWLYTAITRAKQRVCLVGFTRNDFVPEDAEMFW